MGQGGFVSEFESKIEYIDRDVRNKARGELARCLKNNVIASHNKQVPDRNLISKIKAASSFRKEHTDLPFLKTDKGNTTVVMKKQEYDDKVTGILEDTNTYTLLKKDPTESLQTKVNNLIRDLFKADKITEQTKRRRCTYNSVPPKAYGLPKIDKSNVPLRLIVSFIDSPTYALAKYINGLLKNFPLPASNVKDSFQLVNKIRNFQLPTNYIYISFIGYGFIVYQLCH